MTALRTAAPAHAAPTQLTPFKAVSLWIKRSRYLGLHRADEYDALHEWEHHTADFLVRVAEQQFLDAPVPDEFIRLQGEMVSRGYCDDTIREAILHAHRHGSLECFELDEDCECDRAALEATLPDAWDPPWLPGHESGFVGEWIVTETAEAIETVA